MTPPLQQSALPGQVEALPRPAPAPVHRLAAGIPFTGIWRAFVDHHGDVRSESRLPADRLLRPQEELLPVVMGLEEDAVLTDPAQLGQAEDLESPAVGKDGTVPVHETMQPPELPDQFGPGPQGQMVGIAQDDLGTDLLN